MIARVWNIPSELDFYSRMIKYRGISPKADLLARTWLQISREIEEPEHIFIVDVREDGAFGVEDLWIFSPHYAMRIKQFMEKEEFEIFGIVKPLRFVKLIASDYDFKDFDARSRLTVTMQLNQTCEVTLMASQGNCPILEAIVSYLARTVDRARNTPSAS